MLSRLSLILSSLSGEGFEAGHGWRDQELAQELDTRRSEPLSVSTCPTYGRRVRRRWAVISKTQPNDDSREWCFLEPVGVKLGRMGGPSPSQRTCHLYGSAFRDPALWVGTTTTECARSTLAPSVSVSTPFDATAVQGSPLAARLRARTRNPGLECRAHGALGTEFTFSRRLGLAFIEQRHGWHGSLCCAVHTAHPHASVAL